MIGNGYFGDKFGNDGISIGTQKLSYNKLFYGVIIVIIIVLLLFWLMFSRRNSIISDIIGVLVGLMIGALGSHY